MVRFKNRWLLLSLDFPSPSSQPSSSSSTPPPALTAHALTSLLRKTLTSHFGLAASGALGGPLAVKYYSPKTHLAILRCARVGEEVVRGVCCLLPLSFPSPPPPPPPSFSSSGGGAGAGASGEVVVARGRCRVIAVSGTIKKLQQRVIRGDRRVVQIEGTKAKKRAKRGKAKRALQLKGGLASMSEREPRQVRVGS